MRLKQYLKKIQILPLAGLGLLLVVAGTVSYAPPVAAQATCNTTTTPATTYGQVKQSVSVATAGVYRVWSRIKAPNATSNSYYFQVDNGCAYNVGDSTSIAAGAWTWVGYKDGNTASFIDINLSAGTHNLTYTGKEVDVQLDRVLLVGNLSCVPDNATKGDNCANQDTTGPTVSLSTPSGGATVTGSTTVTATANDASGIQQVEFYLDTATTPFKTMTGAGPTYSFAWDTTGVANGSHTLKVKAIDNAQQATTTNGTIVTVSNSTTVTKPDLVVTSVTANPAAPAAGDHVVFSAVVKNQGNAATPAGTNVGISFWVDGAKKTWTFQTAAIPAGGTATLTATTSATAGANFWTAVDGAHSIEAFVDDSTLISESDETNNKLSIPLNIGTGGTPLVGDANNDNKVNYLDFSILVKYDGQDYPPADFDHDGVVGATDLSLLLMNWTF